jgi:hypothetical protein
MIALLYSGCKRWLNQFAEPLFLEAGELRSGNEREVPSFGVRMVQSGHPVWLEVV